MLHSKCLQSPVFSDNNEHSLSLLRIRNSAVAKLGAFSAVLHEVAVRMSAGLPPSEGLTGVEGPTPKMAHLGGW